MWGESAILRRDLEYDKEKTGSTHQDRQTLVDFLWQPELYPLLGEDVGGIGAEVGTEPAHQAHHEGAGAELLRVGSCRGYWVPHQPGQSDNTQAL